MKQINAGVKHEYLGLGSGFPLDVKTSLITTLEHFVLVQAVLNPLSVANVPYIYHIPVSS